MTTTTRKYEAISIDWHRSVKAPIVEAGSEYDALGLIAIELGYADPREFDYDSELGENGGYFFENEGRTVMVLENDQVVAREITRPCDYCGHEVSSTNADVKVCRDCYYQGKGQENRQPRIQKIIRELDELPTVEVDQKSVGVWHTGGGCFCIGAVLEVVGVSEKLELLTSVEASVPEDETDEPRWSVGISTEDGEGWQSKDEVRPSELQASIHELLDRVESGAEKDF